MLWLCALLLACGDKEGGGDTAGEDGGSTTTDGGGTATDGGGTPTDGGTTTTCSGGSGWPIGSAQVVAGGTEAWVYVPADLPPCAGLVFFGHGGSGAGRVVEGMWEDPLRTGLVDLAAAQGFVLVVPGANPDGAPHSWSLDATGDLHGLVAAAEAGVDLDQGRTWFIGQSAGCHMAVYTALYDPGPFDGIGAVSGGIGRYFDYPEAEPADKLPFYVAHDPDDSVVPYKYSLALDEALAEHGHSHLFADWSLGSNGHGWAEGLSVAILGWLEG